MVEIVRDKPGGALLALHRYVMSALPLLRAQLGKA